MVKKIIIEGVSKKFGNIVALDNINLSVEKGIFVTLLGPSGCGKTTLLRIIAGFEKPTVGKIFIDNNDITYLLPERRPVNMVFQQYALFPHMNVFENIAYSQIIKKLPMIKIKEKTKKYLDLVGLTGLEERRVTELSGGQRQRVALARSIINEPEVLLLDEPLGALDLQIRKQMQIELKNIQKRLGTTFVYVTHDQEEAMIMSDTIVLMNLGKIIQIGNPEEIYENPKTTFVAKFIGSTNILKGNIIKLNNNITTVDTNIGKIKCNSKNRNIKLGDTVNISIRPENIIVNTEEKTNYDNKLIGRILEYIYIGSIVRYRVVINNYIITVEPRFIDKDKPIPINSIVFLCWNKEYSKLIIIIKD